MRRSIILVTLLSLIGLANLNASPFSYFQDNGYYVSTTASASILNNSDVDASNGMSGDLDYNTGFGVTGAIGKHFSDSWRVELEYAYRGNDTDNFSSVGPISGNWRSHSLMVNALYDINLNYNFFWYGGVGIGFAATKLELNGHNDTDVVFAHQFLTGFGYRLSQKTSFVVGYRIFHTVKQDYSLNNTSYDVHGPWQHIFEMGLRYEF